ncbi:MAG: glutamate-5-semialdehyde dehydrogenase [Nanoarchaeota archaeon]|nr:glutamate-5-semialdehyde dehydrogenase [Nanoarchaeota archaeon]
MSTLINQVKRAKESSIILASIKTKTKNKALENIAKAIKKNKNKIIRENKKDVQRAKKNNLNQSLIKRLVVDNNKIKEISDMVKGVIKLQDPVGKTTEAVELDKGLNLFKVTVSIGLIGVIFESRPDAAIQISSLCIKSGNAVILKGGSEAENTNKILVNLIRESIKNYIPKESVQIIETRSQVKEILKLNDYIDLLIPRGSNKFVKFIQDNTKIPVLGHSEGICHVYVDKDADIKKAIDISYDAKCQYAAVCNAMETLLVHKAIANKFLPIMIKKFKKADVEIKGDNKTRKIVKNIKKSTEKDWKTEYNDLILSIKIVNNEDEAINHINKYGSKHTDAIVTENQKTADKFIDLVDSSSIMHNCSTRFADGFRYGKGAEVGISTSKIHSRGPVGLEGLVIYKYVLKGSGQVVKDYADGKKKFTHKKIK